MTQTPEPGVFAAQAARAPVAPLPLPLPLPLPSPVRSPPDALLQELLARLCRVTSADVAQFMLVDGDLLRVMASHGVPLEQVRDLRIPVGCGFAGTIAATSAPATISDTSSLDTFGKSWAEEGVRALVGVPLIVDHAVLGVAVVGSRTDRVFGDADIDLLTQAAERAAWAVQNGLLLAAEAHAHAFVMEVLGEWGLPGLTESASLLVSEVVTNDWAPRAGVHVRESSRGAEGGRGLFLVAHLSDGWGSMADDARKTVWFELQA